MREYQRTGAAFLADRPRAILGDEMGLGKSAQVITAADYSACGTTINAVTTLQTEPMCDLTPDGPYKHLTPPNARPGLAGYKFDQGVRDVVIQDATAGFIIVSDMSGHPAEPSR